jgi:hypothetical protein
MKIVHAHGVTCIVLENIDEMPSALAMLPMFDEQATVEIVQTNYVPSVTPPIPVPPIPEPIVVSRPESIVPEKTDAVVAPTTKVRPKSVYVTEFEMNIMRVMRQFPDGITSPEIATLLDAQINHVSAHLWRLRTQRPYADTVDPLVVKVKNKRFKVTPLGMRLKLLVSSRPNYPNLVLGWP